MSSHLNELPKSRENLIEKFSSGELRESFGEAYTEIMDEYFRSRLGDSETGKRIFGEKISFALVAVGGYGRRELCIHSDIDIIIVFGSKIPKSAKMLTDEIFFPLWDMGLDLGYGVRTLKDCLSLSKNDFEVLTSLMDSRFIGGDSKLFWSLNEKIAEKVLEKRAADFIVWLKEKNRSRMERYGDASFLLEPNLKEGIGGLRDYHHILWSAKAIFKLITPKDLEYQGKVSHNEYLGLRKNIEFILLVRNHLHLLSNRKNDQLDFINQEKIARKVGFEDNHGILGVEQFLGKLHRSMAFVKTINQGFFENHFPENSITLKDTGRLVLQKGIYLQRGRLYFDSATSILSDHLLLINIFEQSALNGVPLSLESRRLVGEFLYLIDKDFIESGSAAHAFVNIVNSGNSMISLDQMFDTGLLEKYLPEFDRIKDRVQYDAYHKFPVGRHSLETLRNLKDLSLHQEFLLVDIFSDLTSHESLFLAALFHDIGKNGDNHAVAGAKITSNILKRLDMDDVVIQDVKFLVENHLLLAETATRRDLNDEKVVVQCARRVGSLERLKMLYLLTWADSKATGPKAWNEWTSNLVQELFFKIMHIFKNEELATPQASEKFEKTKSEVSRQMKGKIIESELEKIFDVMSPRYVLNTNPHKITEHLSLFKIYQDMNEKYPNSAFAFNAVEDELKNCWEISILAKDRPGIFSDLAGVFALNNISIFSAEAYTWRDGTAVDVFKVTSPLDAFDPHRTWKKVEEDLALTFDGKLYLGYRLEKKAAPSIISKNLPPSRPPKIAFDNESSDFFTLIEVFADDRVGLLHIITRCLFELRIDIRIAKIATKGDQVADVFYVRDLVGQKLEDQEHLNEIENALLYQIKTFGRPINGINS